MRGFVVVPRVPHLLWIFNSAVVLTATVGVTLIAAVMAAYALGRLQPPGWRWWRRVLFATYVVPTRSCSCPSTRSSWPWAGRQPRRLDPHLRDDGPAFASGCSPRTTVTCPGRSRSRRWWRVPPGRAFLSIMLPMSRNVLVAAALFTLGTVGQDFMLASIILLDPKRQTLAAGLGVMDVSLEELLAVAGVNLAAIPVVIVCAIFAGSYVRGLTAAMVEGLGSLPGSGGSGAATTRRGCSLARRGRCPGGRPRRWRSS